MRGYRNVTGTFQRRVLPNMGSLAPRTLVHWTDQERNPVFGDFFPSAKVSKPLFLLPRIPSSLEQTVK